MRLTSLQRLLLHGVFLHQLLRLLLVLLLHLLRARVVGLLLTKLLMFRFLLLLKHLALLSLLGDQLVLLLFVFFVCLRIPRIDWCGTSNGWKFFRMEGCAGLGCRAANCGVGSFLRAPGAYRSVLLVEISGLCSGCDCRVAWTEDAARYTPWSRFPRMPDQVCTQLLTSGENEAEVAGRKLCKWL